MKLFLFRYWEKLPLFDAGNVCFWHRTDVLQFPTLSPLSHVKRTPRNYFFDPCPLDLKRDAMAAWRRFVASVEALPPDQAAPLWQAGLAEATARNSISPSTITKVIYPEADTAGQYKHFLLGNDAARSC